MKTATAAAISSNIKLNTLTMLFSPGVGGVDPLEFEDLELLANRLSIFVEELVLLKNIRKLN